MGGVITLKHCYEIASFKLQDKKYKYGDYTMKQMVQKVINTAHRCNIDVVSEKNIAPEEHSKIMADIKNRERMRREQAEASAETGRDAADTCKGAQTSTEHRTL